IAIENSGIDHGITGHLECVVVASSDHTAGHGDVSHLVLQRFNWRACSDAPDHGNVDGAVRIANGASWSTSAAGVRCEASVAVSCTGDKALRLAPRCGRSQSFRDIVRQLHDLERSRPLLHATEETALLQRCNQSVDA